MDRSAYARDTKITDRYRLAEAADPARAFYAEAGPEIVCPDPREIEAPNVKSLPLILISQLPRSGGTLLSQLFDGHPQLLVYPSELRIGYPDEQVWADINADAEPEQLFARIFQAQLGALAESGYRKPGKAKHKDALLDFDYSPREHARAFVDLLTPILAEQRIPSAWAGFLRLLPSEHQRKLLGLVQSRQIRRAVLDCYFRALHHAWPAGRASDPRYVVGFAPRIAARLKSIARVFADYPDGRLITIMRNPADWFVSRRAHTKGGVERFVDLESEMTLWNKMARKALIYQWRYGDKFTLISFRDLVADREGTMQRLAAWCGTEFDPSLLQQTFAGKPIAPNTNFDDPLTQRPEAALERASRLDRSERERILALTGPMCRELRKAGCQF